MEDIFETHKNMLKSMLLDEERLITYVSLSKDLCVHVNSSKFLLLRIVHTVRQETPTLKLNVNYIVSGAVDNNNARTIICSESDLDKEERSFKNIFYKHIYSVSKGHSHIDTAAYLTVNKFDDFALCDGLIKNKDCAKLTSVEIDNFKSNSQEIAVPEKSKSVPLKKIKQEGNGIINEGTDIKCMSKGKESKSVPIIKQEQISPNKDTKGNNQTKPVHNQKSQKGIAGFFNKSNNSNPKKEISTKVEKNNETKVKNEIVEKMDIADQSPIKVEVEEKSKKKDEVNKNLKQIKKNSKVDKKRKRVLHVSDSESDSENNDPFIDSSVTELEQVVPDGSDDEIPPTPTVNNVKITSGILNPKKRRKVVDKTYTDEDGYILTKKEEIYESCSENEEEIKVQENAPKGKPQVKTEITPKGKSGLSKKKVSPPQKGKQSTLTNFFKKV